MLGKPEEHLLQIFGILWIFPVKQVFDVVNEVLFLEVTSLGQDWKDE